MPDSIHSAPSSPSDGPPTGTVESPVVVKSAPPSTITEWLQGQATKSGIGWGLILVIGGWIGTALNKTADYTANKIPAMVDKFADKIDANQTRARKDFIDAAERQRKDAIDVLQRQREDFRAESKADREHQAQMLEVMKQSRDIQSKSVDIQTKQLKSLQSRTAELEKMIDAIRGNKADIEKVKKQVDDPAYLLKGQVNGPSSYRSRAADSARYPERFPVGGRAGAIGILRNDPPIHPDRL